ncbi:MAG TPA: hypothetical protein VEB43_21330 [Anaeromyxobacter sp.]|nr:hypothetical protein [Anaeromyxobacter sp.]
MRRARIALLCIPVALAGLAVAGRATLRVRAEERRLAELVEAGRKAGESFVATLEGPAAGLHESRASRLELAERQRQAFDERRAVALSLASARRDRLLGILAAVGAGLAAAGLTMLSRLAREVEEDRRHVAGQARNDRTAEP